MGVKERERKAKRALAELGHMATPCKAPALTPAAKRRASVAKKAGLAAKAKAKAGAVPQANAVGNEPWQLVEPDTTTTGPASSSEPREPARAPPPNPAAGSGNPASSVSSGGGEAEVKVVIPTGEGGASQWHARAALSAADMEFGSQCITMLRSQRYDVWEAHLDAMSKLPYYISARQGAACPSFLMRSEDGSPVVQETAHSFPLAESCLLCTSAVTHCPPVEDTQPRQDTKKRVLRQRGHCPRPKVSVRSEQVRFGSC